MKSFRCSCGNTIYFENTFCGQCGRMLGFLPDIMDMSDLEPMENGRWQALNPLARKGIYRQCVNYSREAVCNWMVPDHEPEHFCTACRLNEVIPNLDKPGNRSLWLTVERRKRRLVYDLRRHGLPVYNRRQYPQTGLSFAFMEDDPHSQEFMDSSSSQPILTGHSNGLITINILEADDVERERMRVQMNEAQRTLLGHFRHEVGHYFWDRLVRDSTWLEEVRERFGDERTDYGDALQRYYNSGPSEDWYSQYVSAYASAHPWEDWAECWAHYLQISDTLETAAHIGMVSSEVLELSFDQRIDRWINLALRINLLNRSMDQPVPYPYVLTPPVIEKLRLVEAIIVDGRKLVF